MAPRYAQWVTHAGLSASLYVYGLSLNLILVLAAREQRILTGEEASLSIWNVLFLRERLQATKFATSFGAHVVFQVGSFFGEGDVFYGRWWKAMLMALVPVLFFQLMTKRLNLPMFPALLLAWTLPLQPGIAAFSWIAMDPGLETVFGLAAIYFALGPQRRHLLASGVLLGFSISSYTAGIVFVLPVAFGWWRHVRRAGDRPQAVRTVARALLAAAAVVFLPLLWWTNAPVVLTGGGSLKVDQGDNAIALWQELFTRGGSYYYFSKVGQVTVTLGALAALGIVAALLRIRRWAPAVAVVVATVALFVNVGHLPGARRAVPLVVGIVMLAGSVGARAFELRTKFRLAFTVAMIVALGLSVAAFARTATDLSTGEVALPTDFAFAMHPGETVEDALDRIAPLHHASELRAQGFEPERTTALLMWRDEHDGRRQELLDAYRLGQWCRGNLCVAPEGFLLRP